MGLPMGNSLSPLLADLVMNDFIVKNRDKNKFPYNMLKRYVDDIILMSELDKDQIKDLVAYLNKIDKNNIQFTSEFENESNLSFLDVLIKVDKENHKFKTTWYPKPTAAKSLLDFRMGLLEEGHPLTWNQIAVHLPELKKQALEQLIRIWEKNKNRTNDTQTWGDEVGLKIVEFSLLRFDHASKRVQLLLKAHEYLPKLKKLNEQVEEKSQITWHEEAGDHCVEGVLSSPFDHSSAHYSMVEESLRRRREQAQHLLAKDEYILNVCAFPRMGCAEFTWPVLKSDPLSSWEQSICFPQEFISPIHPQMKIVKNMVERRKSKFKVNLPLLYDQLIPMTPVMLALSAACPIWRGYLCDVDTRWNALCESADDRTEEEKNNQETFVGLVPIIERYVKEELQGVTESSRENIHRYLELISKRAAGTTATNATWMRQFVSEHPSYKQDSLVTEEIQHDLMWAMQKVANGKEEVESKRP
ncbi:unnamed protein product [Didymodactylos carnosus]|uniref:Glutamate--cysteine ligase n=1 Tax=Didymodactylos carnosus TaxID=1234261 RepID=A0A814VB14_9BILA|nr:unnamed protein product [Didymodactylos carnosus]CAF3950765.1 unnamed protein product [Didymodactylos carnosus]